MFHDTKLQSILEESEQTMKDYLAKLDKTSQDIRVIERLLQKSGISEFSFEIEEYTRLSFSDSRLRLQVCTNNSIDRALRPLIECKANVRLEVAKHLPDFLKQCINKMKEEVAV